MYLFGLSLAALLYEHILTIEDEVRTIWKRSWTAASALLLSIRVNMLLTGITAFLPSVRSIFLASHVVSHTHNSPMQGYAQADFILSLLSI